MTEKALPKATRMEPPRICQPVYLPLPPTNVSSITPARCLRSEKKNTFSREKSGRKALSFQENLRSSFSNLMIYHSRKEDAAAHAADSKQHSSFLSIKRTDGKNFYSHFQYSHIVSILLKHKKYSPSTKSILPKRKTALASKQLTECHHTTSRFQKTKQSKYFPFFFQL